MISNEQFEILSALTRRPDGPSRNAAHAVLVVGYSVRNAATMTGITISGVAKAVNRYRAAIKLIERYENS